MSLRLRITLVASCVVAVVLTAAAATMVQVHRQQLTSGMDDSLRTRSLAVESAVGRAPSLIDELPANDPEGFAQLVTSDGSVLAASSSFSGAAPIAVDLPPGTDVAYSTVSAEAVDDDIFRVRSVRIGQGAGEAVLHVGTSYDDVAESTTLLATSFLVAVPTLVLLLAGVTWWLVGRTLAPVERIVSEVAAVGPDDLGARVAVPGGEDEIARLAVTMNLMLDRLEASFTREKRFVADASHELRSPITRLRAELEVDAAHPEGADLTATHRSLLEEVVGLNHLVDDLLAIAADGSGARMRPLDLDDLVTDEARRAGRRPDIEIDTRGVSAAQVVGDPGQLRRVVRNLIDNATRHAAATIRVSLHEEGGVAVLAVADDGPGVAPENTERVFDRFSRLDDARSSDGGGTGLGLAIVRQIVESHGGSVAIDTSYVGARGAGERSGARFVVSLPSAP